MAARVVADASPDSVRLGEAARASKTRGAAHAGPTGASPAVAGALGMTRVSVATAAKLLCNNAEGAQ